MLRKAQQTEQQKLQLVKSDPTQKLLRRNMVLQSIIVLLWTSIAIFFYIYNRLQASKLSYLFWLYAFLALTNIFSLYMTWRQVQYIKHLDQWRQIAAQGDHTQVSLAAEQPVANISALSVPATLRVQPRYKAIIAYIGIILGIIVISTAGILFLINITSPHTHSSSFQTFLILSCIAILVFLLLLFGILARVLISKMHQQLEVTEQELIQQVGKKVNRIFWEDARLFAIPGIAGTKKSGGPPLSYELSSANAVIRWPSLRRGNRGVLFLGNAEIPLEEYNKQMQSVLSFIAAKTALPLYDLRTQKLYR